MLLSLFPLNIFNIIDDDMIVKAADPVELQLIRLGSDYTDAGFTDLGIYYTNQSLCEFHMPFILERAGNYATVNNTDLDGNFTSATGSFNERLLSYNYSILDSNANYYVVDFVMNTSASLSNFSVDFVPKIKEVEFEDYAWWSSNWSYKKQITIDYTQVPSTLSNFPVLVYRATDDDLKAHVAQGGGEDIAFVDSTETTQFNHELEDYANGNGRLVAWVNVTSVSHDSSTTFWMYYGNGACADQQDVDNTWDSNYTGIFHMYELVGDCLDSTSNSNDGTYTDNLPTRVNSRVLYGQDFDGTNDNITIPKEAGVNGEGTIECWVEPDVEATQIFYTSYGDATNFVFLAVYGGVNPAEFRFYGKYSGTDLIANEYVTDYWGSYHYAAGAWTINDSVLFIDGVSRDTDTTCDTTNFTLTMGSVGTTSTGTYDYDGEMDELRISNIRRSNDWLETCYNNQVNQTTFCVFGSEQEFDMSGPASFLASTESNGDITLTWSLGTNATHTYIERNTVSSWERESGTFIYNDTGTTVLDDDTSLVCNVIYYYQGWSFNSTRHQFSGSVITNNITCPGNPSSSTATVWDGYLNVTWVNNEHADAVVLVRGNSSYPTTPDDGTILQNNSLLFFNDSGVTTNSYYTLFSWNSTIGRHSTGLQRPWGQLTINVYDENTSEDIFWYDIFISSEDGSQTFESLNNTNPTAIDIGESLPYGSNVQILINATYQSWDTTNNTGNYSTKRFVMDIEVNNHYTLDAYLAEKTSTEQYIISVVGPVTEYGYEPPIEDARIQFRRYINDTEGYQNVSILMTGAAGTVSINLIPLERYLLIISKSGYTTEYEVFEPPYIVYSEDRYHKFRLIPTSGTTGVTSIDQFWQNITFVAVMTSPGYGQNGNITITYLDVNSSTTNTQIYLYELFNGTITLVDTNSKSSNNDFSYTVGSINTTRYHFVVLFFNNTASFDIDSPVQISIYALHTYKEGVRFDLNERITNIIGPLYIGDDPGGGKLTLPWTDAIAIILPIILLVSFGVFNTGLGIISCGLSLGAIQMVYASTFTNVVSLSLVALCPLVIVIGIVYVMSKGTGSDHL